MENVLFSEFILYATSRQLWGQIKLFVAKSASLTQPQRTDAQLK